MEHTTSPIPTPQAPKEPEACRNCGSLLAGDQRYCLACGSRRGDARVPVSTLWTPVDSALVTEPPVAVAAPGPRLGDRAQISPTAAAIASAAVVLALVAGLLIGRSETKTAQAPAAAPVTVSVPGAGATSADQSASAAPPTSAKAKKARSRSETAKAAKGTAVTAGSLNALQNTSGKDYSKKSAALPKTTVTQGKPPPKDNKPAGGGTKAVTLGG